MNLRGPRYRVSAFQGVIGALFMLPGLLAGCFRQAPLDASVTPVIADTLWYVSARARDQGRDTRRLADSLEYGLVISRVTKIGDGLSGRVDINPIDSVRLSLPAFASALRERARSERGSDSMAVLMVHGFGTSLHEAWSYATESRIRARSTAPWIAFCWPSNGSGVAWPRANQFLSRAYREDSVAAVSSRAALAQTMHALLTAINGAHLLVVAHSLGAQLVGETLVRDAGVRTALAIDPLRGLAFFAPDVATAYFNDQVLPAIVPLARRVVVYASSNDKLLTFSRNINKSDRAGLIKSNRVPYHGIEFIDATDGYSAEHRVQRTVGTHHGMRRESAALFDLLHIVAKRYSPECRVALGTAMTEQPSGWKLTTIAPPPLTAIDTCTR